MGTEVAGPFKGCSLEVVGGDGAPLAEDAAAVVLVPLSDCLIMFGVFGSEELCDT